APDSLSGIGSRLQPGGEKALLAWTETGSRAARTASVDMLRGRVGRARFRVSVGFLAVDVLDVELRAAVHLLILHRGVRCERVPRSAADRVKALGVDALGGQPGHHVGRA